MPDEVLKRLRDDIKQFLYNESHETPGLSYMNREEEQSFKMWCIKAGEEQGYKPFYEYFKNLTHLGVDGRIGDVMGDYFNAFKRDPSENIIHRLIELSKRFPLD